MVSQFSGKNLSLQFSKSNLICSLEETSYLILEIAIWRLCGVTSIQNLSRITASLELQVHPRLNKAMVPTPLLDK